MALEGLRRDSATGEHPLSNFIQVSTNFGENIMKNMPTNKSIISLAVGSAFAATLGVASIASANESPFTVQPLGKGYMVAQSQDYGEKKDGYGEKREGYGGKKDREGRCGMSMADTDSDGRVSKDEHARHAEKMFDMMDKNKDGFIDKDEASMMRKKHGHGHGQSRGSSDQYGSGDRSGDRSSYGEGQGPGYGEGYGTRSGDRQLQHMKPMGE
jgi:uncharacterized low-complexity protein